MATHHDKPGPRLHQTKTPNRAITDLSPDNEAPWQQLMMMDYLIFEAIDAM